MRMLLIAAAATLTLSACNKPAEDAPPVAVPAADTAMDASTTAAATSGGAMAPSDSAAAEATGMAPAADTMSTGPSQATRDMAQEKAETSNLHP